MSIALQPATRNQGHTTRTPVVHPLLFGALLWVGAARTDQVGWWDNGRWLLAIAGGAGAAATVALARGWHRTMARAPLAWLTAWLVWVLIAAMWSSFIRAGIVAAAGLIVSVLYAAWFASTYGWRRAERVIVETLVAYLAVSVAVDLVGITERKFGRLVGLSRNPTDIAILAAMAGVLTIGLAGRRPRWLTVVSLLLCVYVGKSADGRTAALSAIVACGYLLYRRWRAVGRAAALAGMIAAFSVLIFNAAGAGIGSGSVSRDPSGRDLQTLNGRVDIWNVALDEIAVRPVFGWGTGSSEVIYRRAATDGRMSFDGFGAHNMWLHAWLEHGLIGAGLLTAALISYAGRARGVPGATRDALMLVILINGVTEVMVHEASVAALALGAMAGAVALGPRRGHSAPRAAGDPHRLVAHAAAAVTPV